MKSITSIAGCGLLVLATIFLVAPAASAGTVTVQLNDPPSDNVLDNIYVGPYNGTNTVTQGSVQVICDDFKDESDYNQATYTVNTFSSLGNTMWGTLLLSQGDSMSYITSLYKQAAWLASGMFSQTGTQQGYYSYAVWAVFDPTDVIAWLKSAGDTAACNAVFGAGNNCNSTTITGGLLLLAENNYANGNYSDVLILTPTCNGLHCQEQEFFEFVPEGGSALLYLLLAGLACFGAVRQSRRRAEMTASLL